MVVFSLKLLNNVRKAIAGRKFPHQLAGGVALGVLLGIIPHGNLLALIVLVTVLCFKVNHAMMGVVAIAASFVATRLDDYSHRVGEALLTHPSGQQIAERAWTMPLVPWTDLNNTVVLGSFVIGVVGTLPIFLITLPVFRWIAPKSATTEASQEGNEATPSQSARETIQADESGKRQPIGPGGELDRIDRGHDLNHTAPAATIPIDSVLASEPVFVPLDGESEAAELGRTNALGSVAASESPDADHDDPLPSQDEMVSVETRIDVIRMKDFRTDGTEAVSSEDGSGVSEQPMDEALSYLLQQLRHSQQRKAAG